MQFKKRIYATILLMIVLFSTLFNVDTQEFTVEMAKVQESGTVSIPFLEEEDNLIEEELCTCEMLSHSNGEFLNLSTNKVSKVQKSQTRFVCHVDSKRFFGGLGVQPSAAVISEESFPKSGETIVSYIHNSDGEKSSIIF